MRVGVAVSLPSAAVASTVPVAVSFFTPPASVGASAMANLGLRSMTKWNTSNELSAHSAQYTSGPRSTASLPRSAATRPSALTSLGVMSMCRLTASPFFHSRVMAM